MDIAQTCMDDHHDIAQTCMDFCKIEAVTRSDLIERNYRHYFHRAREEKRSSVTLSPRANLRNFRAQFQWEYDLFVVLWLAYRVLMHIFYCKHSRKTNTFEQPVNSKHLLRKHVLVALPDRSSNLQVAWFVPRCILDCRRALHRRKRKTIVSSKGDCGVNIYLHSMTFRRWFTFFQYMIVCKELMF